MKYRRKQAEVDAVLFDPKMRPWPAGVLPYSINLSVVAVSNEEELSTMGRLKTKFGIVPVSDGDWVLTYGDGTQDALPDAEFKSLYEPIEENHATDL